MTETQFPLSVKEKKWRIREKLFRIVPDSSVRKEFSECGALCSKNRTKKLLWAQQCQGHGVSRKRVDFFPQRKKYVFILRMRLFPLEEGKWFPWWGVSASRSSEGMGEIFLCCRDQTVVKSAPSLRTPSSSQSTGLIQKTGRAAFPTTTGETGFQSLQDAKTESELSHVRTVELPKLGRWGHWVEGVA